MKQTFITNNFTKGRGGEIVRCVILHTYAGVGGDLYKWFQTNTRSVSATYAVLLNGDSYQYVREEDTSHNAGSYWWNSVSISIEHQDNGQPNTVTRTPEQYKTSSELVFDICYRHGLDIHEGTVRIHNEIVNNGTECPGNLDRTLIIKMANQLMDDLKSYKKQLASTQEQLETEKMVHNATKTALSNTEALLATETNYTASLEKEVEDLKKKLNKTQGVTLTKILKDAYNAIFRKTS